MWYNGLSEYLLKEGYVNNPIWPCVFIKKLKIGLTIIAVYVDDLNLIGTPKELTKTSNHLKKGFEIKDLGKQNIVSACRSNIVQITYKSINWHI